MHFPRYWAKGESEMEVPVRNPMTGEQIGRFACWGWSDLAPEEARAKGRQRADAVLERLRTGDRPDHYLYGNGPVREEVLREFRDNAGALNAAVTRNSYGCLVLNTARMLFVDVDEPALGLFASVAALFRSGGGKFETNLLLEVKNWVAGKPDWGWRVYRTRAGMRLLATHQPVSPESSDTTDAFKVFDADPLYQKLCAAQKCFRARITPKPWRCGVEGSPARWPWPDDAAAAKFSKWDRRYLARSGKHATCRFLGHFGRNEIHPELRELVSFHDTATRIGSQLPLA